MDIDQFIDKLKTIRHGEWTINSAGRLRVPIPVVKNVWGATYMQSTCPIVAVGGGVGFMFSKFTESLGLSVRDVSRIVDAVDNEYTGDKTLRERLIEATGLPRQTNLF